MKSGTRALGIAESYREERSHLAGVVVTPDRTVDGVSLSSCTVGGTDSTAGVVDCYRRLDRDDIRYVFVSGIALAWYNVFDLSAAAKAIDRPVLSVTFESSEGLERSLREHFTGGDLDERLAIYEALSPRERIDVNGHDVYVRSAGLSDGTGPSAATIVRAFTPEGGRPEPVRVSRLVARAVADDREDDPPTTPDPERS